MTAACNFISLGEKMHELLDNSRPKVAYTHVHEMLRHID